MGFAEAETSAEVAVVRVAIGNGYLTGGQLREVLLLREEFAERGHTVGLLPLLRQRCLPPRSLPELSRIYTQVLAGLDAKPQAYDPIPSGLMPQVSARARLRLDRHPAEDPARVKAFISRVGVGLDSGSDRLVPPSSVEETANLVARRPDSGRLGPPDSGRLVQQDSGLGQSGGLTRPLPPGVPDSGRQSRAPDSGRLIPHTAEVPAHGGSARQVGSDSGQLIPLTAGMPAVEGAPPIDQNAATQAQGAVKRFGRYLIESELARGGMGVVYKAKDPHLERYVALKVMQGDGFELDPVDVERFVREARATAKMRHPHIVSVLDTGTDHGHPFLVMDLVQGMSLGQQIKTQGPLDPAEAARLGAAIARALDYSHQQGVLHRDVKPNNILLEAERGTPLLTDFGLARSKSQSEASQLTGVGQAVGTPAYMAPEQATGESDLLGPPTDVYGLGATLYHMLVGHPPFRGTTISVMHAVVTEPPKPLRKLRGSISAELEAAVMRALAKDPSARWQSAGELAAALEKVAYRVPDPTATKPEHTPVEPQRRPRRPQRPQRPESPAKAGPSWVALGSTVCSALLVLAFGYYMFVIRPGDSESVPDPVLPTTRPDDPPPVDPPQSAPGREERALALLKGLADDPDQGPDWQRRHQLTRRWGEVTELPWQVSTALEVAPGLEVREVVIAVLLGLDDRFTEAQEVLGRGTQATQLAAELYAQARRMRDALRVLEAAPGDDRAVVLQRLRLHLWGTDLGAAVAEAESSLPLDDPFRQAVLREAEVVARPNHQERIDGIDELIADPLLEFELRGREHRAWALINLERFDEARREADALDTARPGISAPSYIRHFAYRNQKAYKEARTWLERAIALDRDAGNRLTLEFERADLLMSLDPALAGAEVDRLLADGVGDASLAAVAQACARTKRFEEAVRYGELGLSRGSMTPVESKLCMTALLKGLGGLQRWEELHEIVQIARQQIAGGVEADPGLLKVLDEAEAAAKEALGKE